MSSLGIDNRPADRTSPSPSSSPSSSPRQVPTIAASSPHRKTSSQSLRGQENLNASRHRVTRFSPYSSSTTSRRGSLSSSPPTVEPDKQHSISPRPPSSSPRIPGRIRIETKLPPCLFDSSELSANTPISAYARRKTPAPSPSSPTFPLRPEFPMADPMPLSLPSLPILYTQCNASPSPPPNSAISSSGLELPKNPFSVSSLKHSLEFETSSRTRPYRGVRISTPCPTEIKPSPQVAV
jgi:hypothetical protein